MSEGDGGASEAEHQSKSGRLADSGCHGDNGLTNLRIVRHAGYWPDGTIARRRPT
ncbi:MAG TPA: hypothetical protein VGP46_07750 [Acidimicrobiales bacterium]|nr:hypothetical protein [Acidimicrobiales bacterium]